MEHYDIPLVIFTSLSQTAIGLAIFLCWSQLKGAESHRLPWFIVGCIMAVAMVGAIFHLSHPFNALNAFINLRHSWLSREILAASIFSFALLLAVITKGHLWTSLFSAISGIGLIYMQGMTYAAPAMVAIANGIPMIFFALTAWVMGAATLPFFVQNVSIVPLRQGLLMLMLALLVSPLIWRSGSVMMQATSLEWFSSIFFWGGLCCLTVTYLLTLIKRRPEVIAAGALLGILLSRLTFFGDTVSTITNIGNPY